MATHGCTTLKFNVQTEVLRLSRWIRRHGGIPMKLVNGLTNESVNRAEKVELGSLKWKGENEMRHLKSEYFWIKWSNDRNAPWLIAKCHCPVEGDVTPENVELLSVVDTQTVYQRDQLPNSIVWGPRIEPPTEQTILV